MWRHTLLFALLAAAACHSLSKAELADITERWRPNLQLELYPRASRELACPPEQLDCACLDERCYGVRVFGCGRTAWYEYDSNRIWRRTQPPAP